MKIPQHIIELRERLIAVEREKLNPHVKAVSNIRDGLCRCADCLHCKIIRKSLYPVGKPEYANLHCCTGVESFKLENGGVFTPAVVVRQFHRCQGFEAKPSRRQIYESCRA